MQKSFEVLTQLQSIGLIFSVVGPGGLKVEPKDKITDHARVLIRAHKEDIVTHLNLSAKKSEGQRGGHAAGDHAEALRGARLTDLKKPALPQAGGAELSVTGQTSATAGKQGKPPAVAKIWLIKHRQELKVFGWSAGELWRRNKSKRGLAWMLVWKRPGLQVDLTTDGVIQFIFPSTRGTVKQTARPTVWTQNNSSSRGAV